MNEISTTIGQLSADDLAALRAADSVSFHVYEGEACMRVCLRGGYADVDFSEPRIYSAKEQRLFPRADTTPNDRSRRMACNWALTQYDRGDGPWIDSYDLNSPTRRRVVCFGMVHSAKFDHAWLTMTEFLRVGDILTLHWIAGNNSETLREKNMVRDELQVTVKRESRKQRYPLTFNIDNYVGLDNSARMVQLNG